MIDVSKVRREGHYYVFSVQEVQDIIGEALRINPRLVVIETKY